MKIRCPNCENICSILSHTARFVIYCPQCKKEMILTPDELKLQLVDDNCEIQSNRHVCCDYHICCNCGNQLNPSDEIEREDPYDSEFNEDHRLHKLCKECHHNSCLEI